MLDRFRLIPFLVGLAAGFFAMSVYKQEQQFILQYPHPSEATKKVFRDPNGMCYSYSVHEVDCDANEGTLKEYPVQG